MFCTKFTLVYERLDSGNIYEILVCKLVQYSPSVYAVVVHKATGKYLKTVLGIYIGITHESQPTFTL